MTFPKITILTVLLASAAASAQALDLGQGLTLTGDIELEYVDGDPIKDEVLSFAEITLSWRAPGAGDFGFGAEITLEALEAPQGQSSTLLWGGPVFVTPLGELTVGRPRPVIARMIDLPRPGGLRFLDGGIAQFSGSIVEAEATQGEDDVLGLTFSGSIGGLSYGLGLHDFDIEDVRVTEAVIAYQLGRTRLHAALEEASIFPEQRKVLLGVAHEFGRVRIGGQLSKVTQGSRKLDAVQLFGTFAVTDRLDIGLQHLHLEQGPISQEISGVTVEYRLDNGVFAEAGVAKLDPTGTFANLSVGFRF